MKFTEYYALKEHLEKNGSSINEFMDINEKGEKVDDENKLDTGGDSLKRVTSPKFAMARRKITNNAKKFKKSAEEKLINKILPSQLNSLKEIVNIGASHAKSGKSPKEILDAMQDSIAEMKKSQMASMKKLENAIEKMGSYYEKRVNQIIESSDLKDKSKLKLEIYWTLVSTQVHHILYKQIQKKRREYIDELISNKDLATMFKEILSKDTVSTEILKLEKLVKKQKDKFNYAPTSSKSSTKSSSTSSTSSEDKSFESFKDDIENENDKEKLILLANDLKKANNLSSDEKKKLGKLLSEKGLKKEDIE